MQHKIKGVSKMRTGYREQLVVRVTKDDKKELREQGHKFSLRISDFARVALREGLKQINAINVGSTPFTRSTKASDVWACARSTANPGTRSPFYNRRFRSDFIFQSPGASIGNWLTPSMTTWNDPKSTCVSRRRRISKRRWLSKSSRGGGGVNSRARRSAKWLSPRKNHVRAERNEDMKPLLKPEEVCDLLRISKFQLCRMSKRGKIPCVNVSDSPKNATWRYDEAEIERWLEERRRGSQRKAEVRRRIQTATPV